VVAGDPTAKAGSKNCGVAGGIKGNGKGWIKIKSRGRVARDHTGITPI